MQKRVYRQNLWKLIYLLLAAGLTLFWVMALLLQIDSLRSYPDQQNRDVEIIFFASCIAFGVIIVLLLWLIMKERTLAVDSDGFEVVASRPFGKTRTQHFRWREVTATSLITKTYRGESSSYVKHTFKVSIKGKSVEMIERGKYFRGDLIDVMARANVGTPHLSYIWEECREKETRKILDNVSPYCKIARR